MRRFTCFSRLAMLVGFATAAHALPTPNGVWQFNGDLTEQSGSGASAVLNGTAVTNSSFVADTIGGAAASVMQFNNYGTNAGLDVLANLAANGGGARVNQYSVVMDVLFISPESGYNAVFENNRADGDTEIYWRDPSQSTKGIGLGAYYDNVPRMALNEWARYAMTVDMAAAQIRFYRNGQFVAQMQSGSGLYGGVDGRMSLTAGALRNFSLFVSDEFSGYAGSGRINSLAVYNQVLTAADIDQLGGPSAAGVPVTLAAPAATLVQSNAMSSENIFADPKVVGDVTQRWSVDGTFTAGAFGYIAYNDNHAQGGNGGSTTPGTLRLHHPDHNWGHPWIEVNPSVALDSTPVEYVVDVRPTFSPTQPNEALTVMIADAAPDDTSGGNEGQYYNPQVSVRLFNVNGALFVQGPANPSAIGSGTPIATGDTAATLTSFRIVFNYHDGAWFAFYYVNGGSSFYDFPGYPLAAATRTRKVLRMTAETFFSATYGTWNADVDSIRVYTGWQTVPVELSAFDLE